MILLNQEYVYLLKKLYSFHFNIISFVELKNIKINKQLHGSNGLMDLDVDVKIQEGDFVALAGQSGSGKTTLLRILAGLEKANGVIQVGDEIWQDEKQALATQKREIGFVFQDYALFANMSVLDNLLYVNKDKELASHGSCLLKGNAISKYVIIVNSAR